MQANMPVSTVHETEGSGDGPKPFDFPESGDCHHADTDNKQPGQKASLAIQENRLSAMRQKTGMYYNLHTKNAIKPP